MAQLVDATNLQRTEFDVTTAEGPSHISIVTGMMNVFLQAQSQGTQQVFQKESFETLLDPALVPGKFRRAVATVSVASWTQTAAATPSEALWLIEQIEATLDDESGKVQLRVDATVSALGNGTTVSINRFAFQVTTLSIQ